MDNSTIGALSRGLDFGSARLEAVSNNLANLNTPGYKRKDVSFQSMLDAASGGGDTLPLRVTDPRHIAPTDNSQNTVPGLTTDNSGAMRPDGNNVDVDAEGARLAATEIFYQGASQLLQGRFANLKYVITGGS